MTPNLKLRMFLLACRRASIASFNVISFVSFSSIDAIESPSFRPTCLAFESSLTWKTCRNQATIGAKGRRKRILHEKLLSAYWSRCLQWFSIPESSPPLPESYRLPSPSPSPEALFQSSDEWIHQSTAPAYARKQRKHRQTILASSKIEANTNIASLKISIEFSVELKANLIRFQLHNFNYFSEMFSTPVKRHLSADIGHALQTVTWT